MGISSSPIILGHFHVASQVQHVSRAVVVCLLSNLSTTHVLIAITD